MRSKQTIGHPFKKSIHNGRIHYEMMRSTYEILATVCKNFVESPFDYIGDSFTEEVFARSTDYIIRECVSDWLRKITIQELRKQKQNGIIHKVKFSLSYSELAAIVSSILTVSYNGMISESLMAEFNYLITDMADILPTSKTEYQL